jgi:metal-responsive CopG/Arc/MetJ family transcriptional regulator
MKTAISIPDSLFHAAERLARRLGISRSALFQRAVRAFLQEHADEGVTEALNEVHEQEPEAGRLDSLLEQLQAASVSKEDWS